MGKVTSFYGTFHEETSSIYMQMSDKLISHWCEVTGFYDIPTITNLRLMGLRDRDLYDCRLVDLQSIISSIPI